MEIIVREIPKEGLDLALNTSADRWFQESVRDALLEGMDPADADTAEIHLYRTDQNVTLVGDIFCKCHLKCSRCLSDFVTDLDIPLHYTLSPLFDNDSELEKLGEDEVELVKEDLDFSFYEGDRFDLGALLREQIILAVPMQPLCKTDCKGLCQTCAQNLNVGSCDCPPTHSHPQWAALEQLKRKKKGV